MNIGDIVSRNSYGNDILFRIEEISNNGYYILCGINYRLKVTASKDDLKNVKLGEFLEFKKIFKEELSKKIDYILENRYKKYQLYNNSLMPGKILHIDADREYLNLCKEYYTRLDLFAECKRINENEQEEVIQDLLKNYRPDILVITGHDSLKRKDDIFNLENYKSSKYFMNSVKKARLFNPSKDSLVIIAGACESYYEALIESGANIASSPKRVLIHALDPLFVVEKIAYAGIDEILSIDEIIENSITGKNGIGGYETRGMCRKGLYI